MSATESILGMSSARARPRTGTRSDAISSIVRREAGSLLDYFLRRTSSPEDAADLLGETLLVVWRRERSVPSDATQARMWLFGVARNVLSTHYRTRARRTALGERLRLELAAVEPKGDERTDVYAYVRELVRDLDPIDQEIIELVYWEGFSLAEVASILSLRPGTVRSRHARARAGLRDTLAVTGDVAVE